MDDDDAASFLLGDDDPISNADFAYLKTLMGEPEEFAAQCIKQASKQNIGRGLPYGLGLLVKGSKEDRIYTRLYQLNPKFQANKNAAVYRAALETLFLWEYFSKILNNMQSQDKGLLGRMASGEMGTQSQIELQKSFDELDKVLEELHGRACAGDVEKLMKANETVGNLKGAIADAKKASFAAQISPARLKAQERRKQLAKDDPQNYGDGNIDRYR